MRKARYTERIRKSLTSVTRERLPLRFSYEDSYFNHPHQAIPRDGYTALVQAILDTLMGSGQDGKARIYSSNIRIVPPAAGDDRIGYRVIFSTDPATATLVEQR